MLVISETETGLHHYHIREVGPEGMKFGGGAGNALCGKAVAWDTRMPLAAWGTDAHFRQTWCDHCATNLKRLLKAREDFVAAAMAYEVADAMLAERDKPREGNQ